MSVPTEKPDPVKDYEAYKAWRKAQKSAGGAAAPAAKPAAEASAPASDAAAPAAGAAVATAEAPAAAPVAVSVSADPMPHPINEFAAYKQWKARSKGGKKAAAPAATADGSGPRKPLAAHASKFKKKPVDRRSVLLGAGGFAWLLFTGFLGIFGAAMGRFLFPNVLYEPPTSFKIGRPETFLPNTVDTTFQAGKQIWVVRDALGIYVLKSVCTHLGCTPNWLSAENKFKCPCHGSGFRMNGMNFEGPAPRPLERYRVSVAEDGQLLVDTSKVFLQEAEWTSAEAYIPA